MSSEIFLSAGYRTPIGAFRSDFARLRPDALALPALRASLAAGPVEAACFGLPLTSGCGPTLGRRLTRLAGAEVPCFTSPTGLGALWDAVAAVRLGTYGSCLVAALAQPSRVPYYLPDAREGKRLGHARLIDGLVCDALSDPWADAGLFATVAHLAERQAIDRGAADARAVLERERGREAGMAGNIATVTLPAQRRQDPVDVVADSLLARSVPEGYSELGALTPDGKTTEFNRAPLGDAAVCLRVGREPLPGAMRLMRAEVAVREADPLLAPASALEKSEAELTELELELEVVSASHLLANLKVLGLPFDSPLVHPAGGGLARGWPLAAGGLVGVVEMLARAPARGAVAAGDISGQGYAFVLETP